MALQAADEQVSGSIRGEMCSESSHRLPIPAALGQARHRPLEGQRCRVRPSGRPAAWLGVRNERCAARAGGRTGRSRGRIRLSVRVAVTGGTRRADDAAEMECGPVCHAREPPCAPGADRSEADHVGGAISASCRRQFASGHCHGQSGLAGMALVGQRGRAGRGKCAHGHSAPRKWRGGGTFVIR